jgi:hypothetical protein
MYIVAPHNIIPLLVHHEKGATIGRHWCNIDLNSSQGATVGEIGHSACQIFPCRPTIYRVLQFITNIEDCLGETNVDYYYYSIQLLWLKWALKISKLLGQRVNDLVPSIQAAYYSEYSECLNSNTYFSSYFADKYKNTFFNITRGHHRGNRSFQHPPGGRENVPCLVSKQQYCHQWHQWLWQKIAKGILSREFVHLITSTQKL